MSAAAAAAAAVVVTAADKPRMADFADVMARDLFFLLFFSHR